MPIQITVSKLIELLPKTRPDLGVFIESSRQTLKEHLSNWLKMIRTRVAEQTYNSYETLLRVHIHGRIGQIRLSEIKIHDVQKV